MGPAVPNILLEGASVDYIARARTLDHARSRQADGTPYPGVTRCGGT